MRNATLVFLLAVGCAPTTWQPTSSSARARQVSLFEYPWIWLDDQGEQVSFARWRGTPLVVTTIYTSCDSICPRTLDRLRKIDDQFHREHREAVVLVVSMDRDPATAAQLSEYKRERHLPESWHFLSANRQQTEQLVGLLDLHLLDMESHVVHDAKITAFDRNGLSTAILDVR